MNVDQPVPEREFDLADELAAVNLFRRIDELEPAFHQKHWHRVSFIKACVSLLAHECADLPLAMGIAAHVSHHDAAKLIREVLRTIEWDQARLAKYDEQLGNAMIAAFKLSKEPEFPEWLDYATRVISAGLMPNPDIKSEA